MTKIKQWDDCTRAERIERWVNVERVLKAMTPHERRKHFDMGTFGTATPCGTVACAAGQCGLDAWFIKRGLELQTIVLTQDEIEDDVDVDLDFKGNGYGDVVEEFFGQVGSDTIFYDTRQRPVSMVIKEVQHYIRYLKAYPTLVKQFRVKFKVDKGFAPDEDDIQDSVEYDPDTRYSV